ncbi:unnamed protein product [Cyclocybe aegerita]|uniref:Uncharacterized protein n=1 Tax=Cyclocybe aegerita TaxID=1973307 RepID=A0A8S0VS83_CYCAE|nr:unnamed protein product [Cyclocybe aegerita]
MPVFNFKSETAREASPLITALRITAAFPYVHRLGQPWLQTRQNSGHLDELPFLTWSQALSFGPFDLKSKSRDWQSNCFRGGVALKYGSEESGTSHAQTSVRLAFLSFRDPKPKSCGYFNSFLVPEPSQTSNERTEPNPSTRTHGGQHLSTSKANFCTAVNNGSEEALIWP